MYQGEMCKAVYFCCMTHHMDAMRFQSEIIEAKNQAETTESYVSTISHEFRTPVSTAIMFLETLMNITADAHSKKLLRIVTNQLSFLLSLVNNLLDVKMLEQGVFEPKLENFNPEEVLKFVIDMFTEQIDMDGNELSYQVIEADSLKQAYELGYETIHLEPATLPKTIYGDNLRLK